jgi:hypothetical protein
MVIISLIITGMTTVSVIAGISVTHRNLIKTLEPGRNAPALITKEFIPEGVHNIRADNRGWETEALPVSGYEGGAATGVDPYPDFGHQVFRSFVISGAIFLGLGIIAAFFAVGLIARPLEKIEDLRRVVKSAAETKNHFMLLGILEEEIRKFRNTVPGPSLLTRVQNVSGNYSMIELDHAMKELEQYYKPDADLALWLRSQIDKSEFEEIKERLIPQEQELILFVEV